MARRQQFYSRTFEQKSGSPSCARQDIARRQFDGSEIQTCGQFEAVVELVTKFSLVSVIVAQCDKNHSLVGTEVLSIDFDKININEMSKHSDDRYTSVLEPTKLCRLEGFQAHILLKDDVQPSYFEVRLVPIYLKPLVVTKLNNMIEKGIMECVLVGGSHWASPVLIVRKTDDGLRFYADYKVGDNRKICWDSYPAPTTESAFSCLSGMKCFAKIDLASAYNQLELNEASKEITTMNTPI